MVAPAHVWDTHAPTDGMGWGAWWGGANRTEELHILAYSSSGPHRHYSTPNWQFAPPLPLPFTSPRHCHRPVVSSYGASSDCLQPLFVCAHSGDAGARDVRPFHRMVHAGLPSRWAAAPPLPAPA